MNFENFDEEEFRDDRRVLCHSGSGRLFAPKSLAKKTHGRRHAHDVGVGATPQELQKGLNNEKLFRAMFDELVTRDSMPKEYTIRKSSRNEDERFKIDVWLDIRDKDQCRYSIPIQIKSSWRGKHEFIRRFGEKVHHIYVIVMDEDMTPLRLQKIIFSIIGDYEEHHQLTNAETVCVG